MYNTPNDPMFWLHHGGIDRSFWMWQNQDVMGRTLQIAETRTMFNDPVSDNATLNDVLDMAWSTPAGSATNGIKNHVSTLAGRYCYVYM